MKKLIFLANLLLISSATAQWVVQDPAVLAQTILNTYLARDQVDSAKLMINHLGNAASVKTVAGAQSVLQAMAQNSGASLAEVQASCTGLGTLNGGNQLYRPITGSITTPDGTTLQRRGDSYRKFEAAHQTAANYLRVISETESRRNTVLDGIKATTDAVQRAQSIAEVQKLNVIASAQIAALNAIDGQRSTALGDVLVQALNNNTDAAKQEQARVEDRAVDFKIRLRQVCRLINRARF